jgi:carbonic anhydrase
MLKEICLILFVSTLNLVSASFFSYDETSIYGPAFWGNINPMCKGMRQSPVNIITTAVQPANSTLKLFFSNTNVVSQSIFITNTGHGPTFRLNFPGE